MILKDICIKKEVARVYLERPIGKKDILLPKDYNLSHENLHSHRVLLITNYFGLYMWIGQKVDTSLLYCIFGLNSVENVDDGSLWSLGEFSSC